MSERTDTRRWRWRLVAVLALALGVRLAVFAATAAAHPERAVQVDSRQYQALADDLAGAYVDADPDLLPLSVYRTPAYPLFLAATGGGRAALVVQVLVGALTAVAAAVLGATAASRPAGLIAGVAVAVDPGSVLHASFLLTETLFAGAVVAGVLLAWRAARLGHWPPAAAAGGLLAVAALLRPIGLYLFPVVLALLLTTARGRRALLAVGATLAFAFPVGGWIVRNAAVADYPGLSSIQEANLLQFKAAGAVSEATGAPFDQVRLALGRRAERAAGPSATVGELARVQRRIALEELRRHRWAFLRSTAEGAVRMLTGPGTGTWSVLSTGRAGGTPTALTAAFALPVAVLLAGAAVGMVRLRRATPWRHWAWVAVLPAYLLAVSAGPEAYSRFRVPAVPFLAALLGAAAVPPAAAAMTAGRPAATAAAATTAGEA